jgi:hypothetical protein
LGQALRADPEKFAIAYAPATVTLVTMTAKLLLPVLLLVPALAATAANSIVPGVNSRYREAPLERPVGLPSDQVMVDEGARIGVVRIVAGPIFDMAVPEDNTQLFRLANRLHIGTRSSTIAEMLLFRSGDQYDPRQLEESERLLRDTRFLRDAIIRPVTYADGKVEIEVRSQDVWTLNPGISFGRKGGKNTSGFELEELNLLGKGTRLGIGYNSGVDRSSTTTYYRDNHLGRSWWALAAEYSDNSDGKAQHISLDRPFYALDTRWAAGVSVGKDQRVDSLYDRGAVVDQFRTDARSATIYGGRSAGLRAGWTRRWFAGLTFSEHRFDPVLSPATTRLVPPDRKLVYPWLQFDLVEDQYRKARNRDQIERIEDFALGWQASAQLGYATRGMGSDRDAGIFRFAVSKGYDLSTRQTLLWNASAAGRWEQSALANSIVKAEAHYYYRQSSRRLLFMTVAVDAGRNLDADQQILLGGDSGLRAYPLRYQSGTGRWLVTAEQRWYTNWYPFRLFNVGGAAFYDMGRVWGRGTATSANQSLLKDIGVGLRLGANRSALGNVVHVDVSYPLDADKSLRRVQVGVETRRSF